MKIRCHSFSLGKEPVKNFAGNCINSGKVNSLQEFVLSLAKDLVI